MAPETKQGDNGNTPAAKGDTITQQAPAAKKPAAARKPAAKKKSTATGTGNGTASKAKLSGKAFTDKIVAELQEPAKLTKAKADELREQVTQHAFAALPADVQARIVLKVMADAVIYEDEDLFLNAKADFNRTGLSRDERIRLAQKAVRKAANYHGAPAVVFDRVAAAASESPVKGQ